MAAIFQLDGSLAGVQAANAIATVVSTKVLTPRQAVGLIYAMSLATSFFAIAYSRGDRFGRVVMLGLLSSVGLAILVLVVALALGIRALLRARRARKKDKL